MSFMSSVSRLCRGVSRARFVCAAAAMLSVGAMSAHAGGPTKVYGKYFGFDNYFSNNTMPVTWGTQSVPTWTVQTNFPNSNGQILGYPASCFGWHYNFNPANDNTFPKKVSAIAHCNTTFHYGASGTNMSGDFAYDIFLRNDSQKTTPQLEIMVWGKHNSYPIGNGASKIAALTTGGVTYDLWEGQNQGAGYYVFTFVPTNTVGHGNSITGNGTLDVDMKVFFNWLASNRSSRFNNNMYLDVIEGGCEVTRGVGSVSCWWFQVDLQ